MEIDMGLLDNVGDALRGVLGQQGADAPDVLSTALPHLGGLQGMITALQQGGLASQVQSWLGNGSNLPVTAEQIRDALGSE